MTAMEKMSPRMTQLATAILLSAFAGTANAAVLASTDFNVRTVGGTGNATASNLNWTLNGMDDPGSMTATVGGSNQSIFDTAGKPTKTMFTPGYNYGNAGGSWITEVDITVATGFNATIEDVTFDYWAVSGGQDQNVTRKADFEVTLLNPSDVPVGGVFSINDVSNSKEITPGVGTLVTATFTPVALTLPGTYTLRIEGGELGGSDETGNHAGIDNLSINGTVSPIPEPSSAALLGLGGLALILRRRK